MRYITKLLLILLICGCRADDSNDLAKIITVNCYWDLHYESSSAGRRVAYCYRFKKDGSCLYLFYKNKKGIRHEFYDDDVVVPKTWRVEGDTLYIRGIERTIIHFSKDTVLLENPIDKKKDTLIKNCN